MKAISNRIWPLMSDDRGQDMIEYAMLAGFIAVAAGAFLPGVANSLNIIFSRVESLTSQAANPGTPAP